MNLLVTGANGFVGKALCAELLHRGYIVRSAIRDPGLVDGNFEQAIIGSIDGATDWSGALSNVDVVVHLAARVHVMVERATDPLAEFRNVNVYGTENLARQAAQAGVTRLVYVSSIKVNGEQTLFPFTELDEPNPQDSYGISKSEAEQVLRRISAETGLEVVIVRPPLVYGAGVKGNFLQMIKTLVKGVPLPFASVQNLRSLVYLENLVDALILCAKHPAAAGQTYLVSDGEDVSTPELLRQLGLAMRHPARLFSCHPVLLKLAGCLVGKANQVERLLDSLQVDSGKIRRELNWKPPISIADGLKATVQGLDAK